MVHSWENESVLLLLLLCLQLGERARDTLYNIPVGCSQVKYVNHKAGALPLSTPFNFLNETLCQNTTKYKIDKINTTFLNRNPAHGSQ